VSLQTFGSRTTVTAAELAAHGSKRKPSKRTSSTTRSVDVCFGWLRGTAPSTSRPSTTLPQPKAPRENTSPGTNLWQRVSPHHRGLMIPIPHRLPPRLLRHAVQMATGFSGGQYQSPLPSPAVRPASGKVRRSSITWPSINSLLCNAARPYPQEDLAMPSETGIHWPKRRRARPHLALPQCFRLLAWWWWCCYYASVVYVIRGSATPIGGSYFTNLAGVAQAQGSTTGAGTVQRSFSHRQPALPTSE